MPHFLDLDDLAGINRVLDLQVSSLDLIVFLCFSEHIALGNLCNIVWFYEHLMVTPFM